MDLRVAAYCVIVDDDERLLLSRWIEGRRPAWTMPGGGLEPGEDPKDAALREVWEETGYRVELEELLGINSAIVPGARRMGDSTNDLQTLRIVYSARIVGGELRNEVGGSTDRADWFALDALPDHRVKLVDIACEMAALV